MNPVKIMLILWLICLPLQTYAAIHMIKDGERWRDIIMIWLLGLPLSLLLIAVDWLYWNFIGIRRYKERGKWI